MKIVYIPVYYIGVQIPLRSSIPAPPAPALPLPCIPIPSSLKTMLEPMGPSSP